MKHSSRILSIVFCLCYILALIPVLSFTSYASNTYKINGVSVHWNDFSSSPSECWVYANNFYTKIWGHMFNNIFGDSENSLRNLSDSELTLTQNHLKTYVTNAALGSVMRICNASYLHGDDGWGHSQVIVQKDSNGFTVFEGGLSTYPYCREKYYTWSEYMSTSWLGGRYAYIKYIKWPGAPAYTPPPPVHTCNKGTYMYCESAHPHYSCYKCSICGKIWKDTSEPNLLASCSACRPGKAVLQYTRPSDNSYIEFQWKSTSNTTHYNLYIYKSVNGAWNCVERIFYAKSGVRRTLEAGYYRAQLLSYNSNLYETDHSDWVHTNADDIYFAVEHLHNYESTVTAPTCTEKGYTTHTCSCGDRYIDTYVDAMGHIWDGGKVMIAPDESTSGVKICTCTRCSATCEVNIPPLNHTHTYTDAVISPTCMERGYTLHTCSCGNSYADNYVDAFGHDFGEWSVSKEATELEAGEKNRTCNRCGEAETRKTENRSCPSAKFWDVNRNAWYHNAVDFAIVNNIFSGIDDIHFKPSGRTTRAMFVAVLWRLDGREESGAANPFADVKVGSYYEKAVIWATAHKIVAGADATHFSPNGNVTREQVAAFLYRYANAKGYDLSASTNLSTFPDAGKASNYAKKSLAWAVGAGLISGSKDTATGVVYLNPKGNATRAQVAQILMMFTQKIAK